jgi:hypothetical protein
MMSRASKFSSVVAAIVLVAVVVLVAPSFRDPQFKIVNESSEVVTVVASWSDQEKEIEAITPSSSRQFSVNAEAAIKFKVRYSGGREVESKEFYFTDGVTVIVMISGNGIEVRYGFET